MKKLLLFVICVLSLYLISCSKHVKPDIYSTDPDEKREGIVVAPNNSDTLRLVIKYLGDNDDLVRAAAITKLVDIGSQDMLGRIEEKLNDASPLVRESACVALGKIRSEKCIADLISVIKGDKEGSVRREAVKALAEYRGNKDIISPLIDAVGDTEQTVSMAAYNALRSITGAKDIARQKQLWEEWYKKQASGSSK